MALIYPDNVIFYHPLDNEKEFTKNENWSGDVSFVSAKVVSGAAPVNILDVFSFHSGIFLDKAAAAEDRIILLPLDQNTALLHCGVYSVIINVSGTTITSGMRVNSLTTNGYTNAYKISYENGSGYVLLTSYHSHPAVRTLLNLVSISGTDLTSIETQRFNLTDNINYAHVGIGILDDGQHALMIDSFSQQAMIISISGGGFTSGLTQLVAPASVAHDIAPINSSGSLVIFRTGEAYIFNCDFDNDIITFGSGYTFSSELANHHQSSHVWTSQTLYLGDDKVLLVYQKPSSFNFHPSFGRIAQVSGTTITYGDEVDLSSGFDNIDDNWGTTFIELSQLSSGSILYSYAHSLENGYVYQKYRVLTLNGLTINVGNEHVWEDRKSSNNIKAMSLSSVLGTYRNSADDVVVRVGIPDQKINFKVSGVDYPSASGHDHIVVAMWVENPFLENKFEEVLIKFGYHARISPSAIFFGDDTVFNFVGSLNNGSIENGDYDHQGHPGRKSDYILTNISGFLNNNNADIILLHIGTNDIAAGFSITDIRDNISGICDTIWQWGVTNSIDTRVILAKIINWSDPLSASGLAVTELNGLLQTLGDDLFAAGNKISVVNMEDALTYPDDLVDDVHPEISGYNKMAPVWLSPLTSGIRDVRQLTNRSIIDIMPLGDSITFGYPNVDGYRMFLQTLLSNEFRGSIWDGSGVQNFINELDDGLNHFIIMDFRYISNEWTLKTSLDGANWINQNASTSGTQGILNTSGIIPGLSVF